MVKLIKNKKFEDVFLEPKYNIENINFLKCEFGNCQLSIPQDPLPENRTIIRNCTFTDCIVYSSSQQKAAIENTIFENIKINEIILSGILFNEVVLKGKFKSLLMSSSALGMVVTDGLRSLTSDELELFENYRKSYYKNVKWALDISQAEFFDLDLRNSIPARLVKRNPATQVLITKEKKAEGRWKEIKHLDGIIAESTLTNNAVDSIYVASVLNKKKFKEDMEFIKILREEGIAEPA